MQADILGILFFMEVSGLAVFCNLPTKSASGLVPRKRPIVGPFQLMALSRANVIYLGLIDFLGILGSMNPLQGSQTLSRACTTPRQMLWTSVLILYNLLYDTL